MALGDTLRQKRYFTDFPFSPLSDHWDDTAISGFADQKLYVVQTNSKAMTRCILMTTERWVAAVNADGQFGTWRYAMARSVPQVRECLDGARVAGARG